MDLARKSPGYELLRLALPPLERSKLFPGKPLLSGPDLYEAVCLRVDEKVYKQISSSVEFDDDGNPVTGDPIVDQWERELTNGNNRS